MSGRCVHRFNPELGRRRCVNRGGMTRVGSSNHSASVHPLGQQDDDSLRPAHMGRPPGVLVLTDPADQSVSVRSQAVDGRLEVVTSKLMLRRPSSLVIAVGDPGSWAGLTKLASSTPAFRRAAVA
jgi:hypothetical protein